MARPSSSEVPEKPVEGNMHSLRDMVRTKKFHPVDQATLPFQPRPGGQWDVDLLQSKQCSICMATLLDLELEAFPSDASVVQSRVRVASRRTRPVPRKKKNLGLYGEPESQPSETEVWQWQSGSGNSAARVSADELARYCTTLFSAPPDVAEKLQCFASDFDTKLSQTYDPDHRIQLLRASRRNHEEWQAQPPDGERYMRSFSAATSSNVDRRPALLRLMSAASGDAFNGARHAFIRGAKLPPGVSSGRLLLQPIRFRL
ncbi:MAG: hypothetical protein M1815_005376 [Lichina confinis]|nr:MAG: hypothetical protein M1815_005376 [Lichina confinis]